MCETLALFPQQSVAFDDAGDGAGSAKPKVQVLAEGSVGSFDYKVVFDPSREGTPMFEWLNENGYDQVGCLFDLVFDFDFVFVFVFDFDFCFSVFVFVFDFEFLFLFFCLIFIV